MNGKVVVDKDRIVDFCRRQYITRLAVFGSARQFAAGKRRRCADDVRATSSGTGWLRS